MVWKARVECDVLVIGGGLAAIRAALTAHDAGAKTAMVLKGVLGRSGSSAIAGGGLAAVLNVSDVPEDSIVRHMRDTLASGDYVNDPDLVRQLVTQAPSATRQLEQLGAEFVRKESGEIEVFLAPAHTCRRSVRVAGGGTARLMGPLADDVRHLPIVLHEKTAVLDIVQQDGRAVGAVGVREDGLVLYIARA
ncbi:MAG TPA: FAD-binding protein, partial [Burkholderiales bacterium]